MPPQTFKGEIPTTWINSWYSAAKIASDSFTDDEWVEYMIRAMYPLIAAHAMQVHKKRVIGLAREYATYDDLIVVEHPREVARQILATVDADASAI